MPPAVEDEDFDSSEEVTMPVRKGKAQANGKRKASTPEFEDEVNNEAEGNVGNEEEEEEEEEEGEDLDEDEFIVEKIVSHKFDSKTQEMRFHVKWEGWPNPEDMTWEPEDNLKESASEILEEYFSSKGGRDAVIDQTKAAIKGKKRGRLSVPGAGSSSSTPSNKRSRGGDDVHPKDRNAGKAADVWKLPAGSWEELIDTVEACADGDDGGLMIYVTWKDGKKSQHAPHVIYNRAPQTMLKYYERHVKIIPQRPAEADDEVKADTE